MTPQMANLTESPSECAIGSSGRGQLQLAPPLPTRCGLELERPGRGRQPDPGAPGDAGAAPRRSPGGRALALLGPLGVLLLTPLILLAGLVALIGLITIASTRRAHFGEWSPEPSQLARVVGLKRSAGEIPQSRAA